MTKLAGLYDQCWEAVQRTVDDKPGPDQAKNRLLVITRSLIRDEAPLIRDAELAIRRLGMTLERYRLPWIRGIRQKLFPKSSGM